MRILLDTSVLICREDVKLVPEHPQHLLQMLAQMNAEALVRPLSIMEIEGDRDPERRRIVLSTIRSYPLLMSPSNPDCDPNFVAMSGIR